MPKKGNFLRQHLIKAHGWEGKPLQFILSVFSTEKATSPVYECQNCLLRFTHRERNLQKFRDHQVTRIPKDEKDCYPKQIIDYLKGKGMLSERGQNVLNQYYDFCRDKLKQPLSNCQVEALTKVFKYTINFKRTDLVGKALDILKSDKSYTCSAFRKLCFDLKNFVKWLISGQQKSYRISKVNVDDAISMWLRETSRDNLKEQKKRKDARFYKIPSMAVVCEAQHLFEKFIEEPRRNRLSMASTFSAGNVLPLTFSNSQ